MEVARGKSELLEFSLGRVYVPMLVFILARYVPNVPWWNNSEESG